MLGSKKASSCVHQHAFFRDGLLLSTFNDVKSIERFLLLALSKPHQAIILETFTSGSRTACNPVE